MAINSLSSSSHGLSGLVSGMDTQSMVDSMLAGTQAKIDKAKASKTILGYKRQIYRDSMSSMKAFQKNFFSFGGSNNMLSSSFYNSMTAVNASKAFKATATGGANTGKTTVNSIQQLAQSLKYKSQLAETAAKVEGKLDISKLKNGTADGTALEIQLQLDGISKTIKLPQGTKDLPLTEEEFVKQLNASIKHAFGSGVSAELSVDKTSISFTPSDASREFYITGNINAMSVLGLKTGSSNKINTRMQLGDLNFAQKLQGTAFKFKINGVEIAANADESLDTVISRINNSEANVKVRYSAIEDKFSIESTVSGKDTKIEMSQSEGNLLTSLFGVGSGGAITSQTQYTYGNITSKLSGVTDKSTPDEIAKIVDAMNNEINRYAGEAKGSFVLNVDGKDITVELAKKDTGKYDFMDLQKAITDNAELKAKGVTLEMGITTASDGTKSFTGDVTLSANAGVKLAAGNGMSIVGIKGNNESVITAENAKTATLASMGMANGLTININGKDIIFGKDTKFADMLKAIETDIEKLSIADATAKNGGVALTPEQETAIRDKISFQVLEAPPESKGKVRLFGVDIPIDITIIGDDKKLFDAEKVSLNSAGAALGKPVTEGQNAVMYINGERVERNSNEFTVSGMSFELKETFYESYAAEKAAAESAGTAFKPDAAKFESIDVTRNTDQIFDGVKKFMDEYNKIVENTWSMLKAETTYKDYPPLTDKQKDDMSEHEIELWEKKSQEGLMRRDETMTAIMDSMRQVLTARPAGSKYSLADMGISVGYDMEKGYGGKLIFNDNAATGEKLKEMIAQEPEALEKLFADYDTGLLPELNRVFEAAVGPGKGGKYNKLSLQDLAGSPTVPDTSSKMYKEAKAIDENLTNLNRKYKAEYTRYWKQFNNMEQMIQQMNQQSSWLTQQLGN